MTSTPISPSLSRKYWCPCETCKGQGVSSDTPIVVYDWTAQVHDMDQRLRVLEANTRGMMLRTVELDLRRTAYRGIRKPPP
jgi:hypothetical protein